MRAAWWSRWRAWWRRGPGAVRTTCHIVLYTRHGCHLCETALQQVQTARRRHYFQLEVVDVDTDSDLVARHGEWVPVVVVNGKVRFRGRVNEVLLNRVLRAEASPRPRA